jgi:hypothetical protein
VIDGVHTVFLVTAPIAVLALLAVIAIKEVPLRGAGKPPHEGATPKQATRSPEGANMETTARNIVLLRAEEAAGAVSIVADTMPAGGHPL